MALTIRDTSSDAYRAIEPELTGKRREVMLKVHECFRGRTFTRKQLAKELGWEINRVTGRVLELIDRGYLQELDEKVKEEGFSAHLLTIPARQLELLEAA